MNRREEQQHDRDRDFRSGNRDMGQSRDARYQGAYRFDEYRTTPDQYGDMHDRHRQDQGQADQYTSQSASRNYGNMGSYGGAQGFGSTRGGYSHPQQSRFGFDATSGHGSQDHSHPRQHHQIYGAYWDRNSFNENDPDRFSQQHRSQHQDRNRYNEYDQHREDNSRYELYDTHQRQFNTGSYNNDVRFNPSYDFNRHLHQEADPRRVYGSYQRAKFRQGDGNDQDRRYTSDLQEGNMAGSLSYGYDGYRGYPEDARDKRYDPMTGKIRNQDYRQPDEDRRDNRHQTRGGYGSNNQDPDERFRNR